MDPKAPGPARSNEPAPRKKSVSTGAITSGGAPWSWPSSMASRAPGMAPVVASTVRWNQSGLFAPPSTSTGTVIFAR